MSPELALAQRITDLPDPTADLYPAKRNEKYVLDRPLTDEKINANYNNFYEFGSSKNIAQAAQALKIRPWTIKIDGMVEKPFEIGIDDLIRKVGIEERLYRHRCVEAWSMTMPWSGFPMAQAGRARQAAVVGEIRADGNLPRQVDGAGPEAVLVSVALCRRPDHGGGDQRARLPGHRHLRQAGAKQHGAPLRLAVPWKYGFKSIKSIVRFSFTDKRPKSYWEDLQSSEYGFWANVNPEVSHPRWSQATEEILGTGGERKPTLLFNGYGEYVAGLYKGLESERLWA